MSNADRRKEVMPKARLIHATLESVLKRSSSLLSLKKGTFESIKFDLTDAHASSSILQGSLYTSNRGDKTLIMSSIKRLINKVTSITDTFDDEGILTDLSRIELQGEVQKFRDEVASNISAMESTFGEDLFDSSLPINYVNDEDDVEDTQDQPVVLKSLETTDVVDQSSTLSEIVETPDLPDFLNTRMTEMKNTIDRVTKKYRSKIKKLKRGQDFAIHRGPIMFVSDPGIRKTNLNRTSILYDELVSSSYIFHDQVILSISTNAFQIEGKRFDSNEFSIYVNELKGFVENTTNTKMVVINDTEPFRMRGFGGQVFLWLLPLKEYNKMGTTNFEYVGFPFNIPAEVRKVSKKDLTGQRKSLEDDIEAALSKEINRLTTLEAQMEAELSMQESLEVAIKEATYQINGTEMLLKKETNDLKRAGIRQRINTLNENIAQEKDRVSVSLTRQALLKTTILALKKEMREVSEKMRLERFNARHKTKK